MCEIARRLSWLYIDIPALRPGTVGAYALAFVAAVVVAAATGFAVANLLVVWVCLKAQDMFGKGRGEAYSPNGGALIKVLGSNEHVVRCHGDTLRYTSTVDSKIARTRRSFKHRHALIAFSQAVKC